MARSPSFVLHPNSSVKVFAITFVSAIALHVAAAVGIAAFGVAHGTSVAHEASGAPIEVMTEPAETKPIDIREPIDVAPKTTTTTSSRGAPNANVAHLTVPATTTRGDALPVPLPTQTAPAHFKMTVDAQIGRPQGRIDAAPSTASSDSPIVSESDVTERAKQVGGVTPSYPRDARAQGVELSAPLPFEIVVDETGHVTSAHALRHAGYGFDEAALTALRTYRFSPAIHDGHAVAVRMKWTVDFRLD